MNDAYGVGAAAIETVSVWALWIGIGLLAAAIGVAIWLAMRADER